MSLLPHLVGFFVLVLLQTAILPQFGFLASLYDLLIAWVIYIGLYRPMIEGLVAAVASGLVMDALTGTGFGVYTTSYFWIWLAMRGLPRVVNVHHMAILSIVVAMGVLFENVVIMVDFYLLPATHPIPEAGLRAVIVQVCWALATGYLFLAAFNRGWRGWDRWVRRKFAPRSGSL